MKKKTAKEPKIQHDHTCGRCGKPATINIQNWWHEYSIDNKGNTKEIDDWEGDQNDFFCDDCRNTNI